MKDLAKFALMHNMKVAVFPTFIIVWDDQGSIVLNKYSDLKRWLGY